MTSILWRPPREARPIILRRLCEQFTKPFDSMEVYKSQKNPDQLLTMDEIAKLLPLADYLEVVAPAEHNRRALYRFKDDERLPKQVGLAAGPRRCGKCGRDIHRGERIYDPAPRSPGDNTRGKWYCRECGLVELRAMYLALEGRPQPNKPLNPRS